MSQVNQWDLGYCFLPCAIIVCLPTLDIRKWFSSPPRFKSHSGFLFFLPVGAEEETRHLQSTSYCLRRFYWPVGIHFYLAILNYLWRRAMVQTVRNLILQIITLSLIRIGCPIPVALLSKYLGRRLIASCTNWSLSLNSIFTRCLRSAALCAKLIGWLSFFFFFFSISTSIV